MKCIILFSLNNNNINNNNNKNNNKNNNNMSTCRLINFAKRPSATIMLSVSRIKNFKNRVVKMGNQTFLRTRWVEVGLKSTSSYA